MPSRNDGDWRAGQRPDQIPPPFEFHSIQDAGQQEAVVGVVGVEGYVGLATGTAGLHARIGAEICNTGFRDRFVDLAKDTMTIAGGRFEPLVNDLRWRELNGQQSPNRPFGPLHFPGRQDMGEGDRRHEADIGETKFLSFLHVAVVGEKHPADRIPDAHLVRHAVMRWTIVHEVDERLSETSKSRTEAARRPLGEGKLGSEAVEANHEGAIWIDQRRQRASRLAAVVHNPARQPKPTQRRADLLGEDGIVTVLIDVIADQGDRVAFARKRRSGSCLHRCQIVHWANFLLIEASSTYRAQVCCLQPHHRLQRFPKALKSPDGGCPGSIPKRSGKAQWAVSGRHWNCQAMIGRFRVAAADARS